MRVRSYIDEQKRTCVVVIDDCENDVRRKLQKLFDSGGYSLDVIFNGTRSYLIGPFRGKAKCAPEDEFDTVIGLKLARERAFEKYNRAFNRELDFIWNKLDTLLDDIEDLYKEEFIDNFGYCKIS